MTMLPGSCRPASLTTSAKAHMALVISLLVFSVAAPLSLRAEDAKLLRGKSLLAEKCARCHSIDAQGDSPLKAAPPMRDIYARFAPTELKVELMEGMVSRHRQMPQIDFSEKDAHAIVLYLYALAVKK